MTRLPEAPCALSEASYRTMSAMLRITTVKANTFTTAARTPATKNAVAVKAWASRSVTAPDGSGRFGWLTRSVSRSYRSFRALPPAVKDAAAAPASASGPANAPQAPDHAAITPPIPTPRADITQLIGRASRRRPAIFGARYGATRTNRCPFRISRMTGRPPNRRNGFHRNTYLRSPQCIPSPIGFRDGFLDHGGDRRGSPTGGITCSTTRDQGSAS